MKPDITNAVLILEGLEQALKNINVDGNWGQTHAEFVRDAINELTAAGDISASARAYADSEWLNALTYAFSKGIKHPAGNF